MKVNRTFCVVTGSVVAVLLIAGLSFPGGNEASAGTPQSRASQSIQQSHLPAQPEPTREESRFLVASSLSQDYFGGRGIFEEDRKGLSDADFALRKPIMDRLEQMTPESFGEMARRTCALVEGLNIETNHVRFAALVFQNELVSLGPESPGITDFDKQLDAYLKGDYGLAGLHCQESDFGEKLPLTSTALSWLILGGEMPANFKIEGRSYPKPKLRGVRLSSSAMDEFMDRLGATEVFSAQLANQAYSGSRLSKTVDGVRQALCFSIPCVNPEGGIGGFELLPMMISDASHLGQSYSFADCARLFVGSSLEERKPLLSMNMEFSALLGTMPPTADEPVVTVHFPKKQTPNTRVAVR